MITVCFASCNTPSEDPSDTVNESVEATESQSERVEYNDGKLRIFANGEYYCRIVRSEGASQNELDMYVAIRKMFKEITGVNPPLATDFKGLNESYDPNEFAILIDYARGILRALFNIDIQRVPCRACQQEILYRISRYGHRSKFS